MNHIIDLATYICNHLQNGLDLVDGLLDATGKLAGELSVLLGLFPLCDFLFGFLGLFFNGFRLGDVFDESDVAYDHALLIFDVTVVINCGDFKSAYLFI